MKTDICVNQISVSIFGGIKLKKVLVKDHHKDTLIYINRIKTNIPNLLRIKNINNLINGKFRFGTLRMDRLFFNLKKYKGENETNIDKFIELFGSGKPHSENPFVLTANYIYVTDSRFTLTDENAMTPKSLDFTKMQFQLKNFNIRDNDINTEIKTLSFLDHRGIFIKDFNTKFNLTKESILLKELNVTTANSKLAGEISLTFKEGDLANFVDKVNINARLNNTSLSTTDINYFYNEFGKKQSFVLKTHITGTLNNLFFNDLDLVDNNNSIIKGQLNFKNLLGTSNQPFSMKANLKELSSSCTNLKIILPRILGEKLPSVFERVKHFNIIGTISMTKSVIDANLVMKSETGNISTDLVMTHIDHIEKATYKGNIIVNNFNAGVLLNQKDLGLISFDVDVDGKGFDQKYIDSRIKGNITKLIYKDYTYEDIIIDGKLNSPCFEGLININDPNLKMSFNGLFDLKQKEKNYDFHIQLDYADLYLLHLIKRDSISILKGDLKIKVAGNTFEELYGTLNISNTSYQKNNCHYYFDDFTIKSSFDQDKVRTIVINSPDIIDGKVIGKYEYRQLPKIFENALGSLYTNYSNHKVSPGQFLRFNFVIYNKIIEIFFPKISLGKNTFIRGDVNADQGKFKFDFNSQSIEAFENYFSNIKINIDNRNPLYNAYIEMDSIRTKYYKISKFSSVDIIQNDTLFIRSEFRGGNKNNDYYNLNLFHTINKKNKSVVGFKKSEINFKDYIWFLNEKSNNDNKITFNKSFTDIAIDKITMSHENQNIELFGIMRDSIYKDLNLSFKDVNIAKITPSIDNLVIDGNLNGNINFRQNKNIYQPNSSIQINDLKVNKILLGNLKSEIVGNESLRKFNINNYLVNDNFESFSARGDLDIVDRQTLLALDIKFDKFNLNAFAPLGGTIISDLRGLATGLINLNGNIKNPEISGRIYLDQAGIKIPYLNIDYEFNKNAIIDLTNNNEFLFRNITITDTKYKTEGKLNGSIKHKDFQDWRLDLDINSSNLLVLDTKDSDEATYYGTAFIEGKANLKGPTDALAIKVDAKSKKGTSIKIPVNNSETVGNSSYIHFLTSKEKYNLQKGIVEVKRDYGGLGLEFNLDITPDAEIEIQIDKSTKHGIIGKGFGTILLDINTTGKFQMYGNFQAYEGYYNFKYGGIIDKRFNVKNGGYINWEGDPLRAVLNIQAVYKTDANPAVLLDNPTFNKKTPVEVVIDLTGNLSNPQPDFTIEFPGVSSVLKSEIQYKLDDKDTRQTQALYLLASGSFLSNDNTGKDAFAGSLFEKASSLFDDLFSDKDGKFKVGVNYAQGTKTPGNETDGRFGFTVSTQLNENITINGKLGVPIGGLEESVIVGNVEMLFRLNEDRSLNVKVFNKENDINYIGEGIGYTQGVGISYQTDFDKFRELILKILNKEAKNKQKKVKNETANDIPDSDLPPEFIKMIESKNSRRSSKSSNNSENIPSIED